MATARNATEPLSVLVARVLVPLVWQLDDESPGSLAMWADLLRVVPEGGASERDLGGLAHVSPRSMHVLLTGAERMGFVTSEKAPKVGKFVRRTAAGVDQCRVWTGRVAEAESTWRREHDTEALTTALEPLVGCLDIGLPWLLLPYGPSDNRASIGPHAASTEVSDGLPLLAQLSQLLAAYATAYEAKHGWMLSMMVVALGAFPDAGLPVEDVPPFAGVKGNGKTLHERHGIVHVENGVARLTPKGVGLRDRHRPTIDAVEEELARRAGDKNVAAARKALVKVAHGLPSAHVHHLCMEYRPGPRWVEASPRGI